MEAGEVALTDLYCRSIDAHGFKADLTGRENVILDLALVRHQTITEIISKFQ